MVCTQQHRLDNRRARLIYSHSSSRVLRRGVVRCLPLCAGTCFSWVWALLFVATLSFNTGQEKTSAVEIASGIYEVYFLCGMGDGLQQ